MSKLYKRKVLPLVFAGTLIMNPVNAQAEQDKDFALDPVVITASRYEKKDLDVAATTSIYDNQYLVSTGATTVEGALRYATGIVYKAETIGSGGGEFLIRGKRRGTVVLVNGIPMNFRTGYYDLDSISLNDVERIEVIRGGGAVLYGSDSTGGIINIITKAKLSNSVTTSFGNFGVQKHSMTLQEGKLGVGVSFQKMRPVKNITAPSISSDLYDSKFFNYRGGEKKIISTNYQFDDTWRLSFDFSDHTYGRSYNYAYKDAPAIYDLRDMNDDDYKAVLNFKKDGWLANAFYHRKTSDTNYTYYDYISKPSATLKGILDKQYLYNYKDEVAGLDVQKEFAFEKDTLLVGANVYRESYMLDTKNKPSFDSKTGQFKSYGAPTHNEYARNVYSVFLQYDHMFDDKNSLIMGARETWTGGTATNYDEFTPQVQFLHKLADNTSLYASVGKSFTLPTTTDMYGRGTDVANPGIKPETGVHYEAGVKHISGEHSWKLALFKSEIKDFIRLQTDKVTGLDMAMNEDTKNMGVEVECEIAGSNGWRSNWGVSLGNPKFFDTRYPDKGWQRSYGRLQLNGGIAYSNDKWNLSLHGSYMGQRVLESYQISVKPMLLTGFRASYKPEKNHEIFLNIDNLLDRKDITSHVSSLYYALPINFEIGYKVLF